MSEAKAIHDQLNQADSDWGKKMREKQVAANLKLKAQIADQDRKLAEKAGLSLEQFQQLCKDDDRVIASILVKLMPTDTSIPIDTRINAARKAYDVLYPDETRKDLR